MRRAALALALALVVPNGVARGAVTPLDGAQECVAVAFSPAVATDRTGFCIGYRDDPTGQAPTLGIEVWVTRDLGHTWVPTPAVGMPSDPFSIVAGVAISPAFAADGTLYVALWPGLAAPGGLYSSNDLGATWTLADDSVYGSLDDLVGLPPVAPVAGAPVGLPSVASVRSDDGSDDVSVTSGPVHRTAAGSPDDDVALLPVAEGALMLAETTDALEYDGTRKHATLYSCDAQITCTTALYSWSRGELPWRMWLAPDYATSHEVVVLTRGVDHYRTLHAWSSRDGGRHFTPYAAVNRILATEAARGANNVVAGIAWRPGHTATRYLRVELVPRADSVPSTEIYRTDDAGKTWRRVAYRACDRNNHCTGTVQWWGSASYAEKRLGDVTVLPDGRVILLGAGWEAVSAVLEHQYVGTYCSVDGGKHFAHNCAS